MRVNLDVVIVTYNSGSLLPDVIGPLPDDVNIIVVDNASRDKSLDVARDLGIKVIENATNSGFASAANRGATRGSADLILFLNPDAIVERATLERLVEEFEDPRVAVASPQLRRPDGTLQRTTWPFPSSMRAWRDALGMAPPSARRGKDDFVVGAVFMCRREAFESIGGFDARFWLYGEETDLCRRLLDEGWDLRLVSDVEATHIGKASWNGGHAVAGEHRRRGGEHFVAKHEGRGGLLSYRMARLIDSAMRSTLPGPEARRLHHRHRLSETAAALVRSPVRVAVDSPVTRVPGAGIVVFATAPWLGTDRSLQTLLEDLLDVEPERRILYVEPAFVPLARLWCRPEVPREAGLRPVHADGRVIRFQPQQILPFRTASLNQWLTRRQVRRALRLFGLDGPTYVVADPVFRDAVQAWGVPTVVETAANWPLPETPGSIVDDLRAGRLEDLQHRLGEALDGRPDERFRVLYLAHRGDIGGNSLAMERLLDAMESVDPHVILGAHGPIEDRLIAAGRSVEVLSIDPHLIVDSVHARLAGRLNPSYVMDVLRAGRSLYRRILELEPAVVHTTTVTSGIIGGLAARRAGVPVVWQMRESVNPRTMSRPAMLALRLAGRFLADAIITNSQVTWRALGLTRRGPGTASRVIGDLVEPAEPVRRSFDDKPITVAMVSRLVPWKGQQVFLDAFAKAFPDGEERALLVGEHGDARYVADLVEQVRYLGLEGRVTFTGFVEDIGPLLDEADVLVHASLRPEPFSQVIVEGMAKGLPVVASQSVGAIELINDGMDGLLCPPSDVDAIAERLQVLAADPLFRRRLGDAARRRANAFRPEVVAAQITRTYRQVVTAAHHGR